MLMIDKNLILTKANGDYTLQGHGDLVALNLYREFALFYMGEYIEVLHANGVELEGYESEYEEIFDDFLNKGTYGYWKLELNDDNVNKDFLSIRSRMGKVLSALRITSDSD